MSVYITRQELQDRIGEEQLLVLSDRDSVGEANEAVITQAIADATDEINMHLAVRYVMPLPEVPETIKRLAVSLTVYWMCESEATMSELIENRYENAVKTLKALANGTMRLGLPEAETPGENSTGSVQRTGPDRTVNRTNLGSVL